MTAHEASSSSSSKSKLWNYNVFLSFRGEDTRNGFTGHLHSALATRGYQVFVDEDDLKRGQEIKEELFLAIEESGNSIIVFSERYVDLSWRLDELVKIMECRSKLGRHALPIFYHVDPSHVRKQTGVLSQAFKKCERDISEEKDDMKREAKRERVKQWREALTKAANLSGHHFQITDNRHEAKLIREIVDNIITEWLPSPNELNVAKHPVGINSRVQDIISHLSGGGSNDVVMVGILGMRGLGKAAVTKAINNEIHRLQSESCVSRVIKSKAFGIIGGCRLLSVPWSLGFCLAWSCFGVGFRDLDTAMLEKVSEQPHQCLKVVEIAGYRGHKCCVKHVRYLVKNAVALEKIVINPIWFWCRPTGIESNALMENEEEIARDHAIQRLKKKMPASVEFVCL